MALSVKIKSETDVEYTLSVTRVDQRVTVEAIVTPRAGQELPRVRPSRSRRRSLFILTGKASQTEKDNLESASKTWWSLGSGATKGRVRFTWGDNNGGSPYECAIMKFDPSQEAQKGKYDYLMELEEGAF